TGVPGPHQFDAWHSRCSSLIDMSPITGEYDGFRAKNEIWDIGGLAVSQVVAPSVQVQRRSAALKRDSIDHWCLAYAKSGTTTTRVGETVFPAPRRIPFLWSLGEPFDGERTDIDWTVLFISRDTFRDIGVMLDAARNRMLDTPLGSLLGDYI